MYDVSEGSLSYLCQYVPGATVALNEPADAYGPAIVERTLDFVRRRAANVAEHCMDCSVVGVCRGGCIMGGLTVDNALGPAGCACQRTLWQLFVEDAQTDKEAREASPDQP